MSSESVKVAVRVRPFNQREKDRNATCIIRMPTQVKTIIINPDTQEEKEFAFDYSYWSHDGFDVLEEPDGEYPGGGYNAPSNRNGGTSSSEFGMEYASQLQVFQALGKGVLDNALAGFNCCLFAYGQTGSGKSYSFVGYGSNRGIVPQVCDDIFKRKETLAKEGTELQVTFGMLEIYNEKIRDLLNPDPKTNNDLKVRTTPKGTFVEGVKARAVNSFKAINDTMEAGTASRTVAATQMNATSSRAHTVMTISVKQLKTEDGLKKELASDMNLVDLAGSERAESTGATGDRLKEGAAINKSLSSLGNVISALADQSNNPKKKVFIPYRDSKLTQILQSALGGNSKTIMVAALSPADINFEETLSTLRYADRAKQIKVTVEVQENPTDKLIRQLKEENDKLKKMMEAMGGDGFDPAAFAAAAGGGGGDAKPEGTVTEEEMEAAIAKAVEEVKAASAADKAKAIQAVKQQIMARHEAVGLGMITRSDLRGVVVDCINGSSADAGKKKAAVESFEKKLAAKSEARTKDGGTLDRFDALLIVDDVLSDATAVGPDSFLEMANKLFGEQSPIWSDHRMTEEECVQQMKELVNTQPDKTTDAEKKHVEEHTVAVYRNEVDAAKSDLYTRAFLEYHVEEQLKALGMDKAAIEKGIQDSKRRFELIIFDNQQGNVDEAAMHSSLATAMKELGATDKETGAAAKSALKAAGFATSKNLTANADDAQNRAKMMIAQTLAKNTEMMANLTMSYDQKVSESDQEAAALMKTLGLSGLTQEEMKVTPSLRNLNQDATMTDALVYYLAAGQTILTTTGDENSGDQSIALSGSGVVAQHGAIAFDKSKGANGITFIKMGGTVFLNGQVLEAESTPIKHNDRIIVGNESVFRVVNPLDPESQKPQKKIIDWDLAQTELSAAMGTSVDLKVDEEVKKKKAELDAQLKAMEEKFAKENAAMMEMLAKADPSAAQAARMRQMDSRKASIETYKARVKLHLNEYKRELFRLEEQLKKVLPAVSEANVIAQQLGRVVSYSVALVTRVPQEMAFSPVEELLTQKVNELLIRVDLTNPRSNEHRDWFWPTEHFYDRVGAMRNAWQDWMLKSVPIAVHSASDPFYSSSKAQLVGSAYLYLAPVAYGIEVSEWVPIWDYRGQKNGRDPMLAEAEGRSQFRSRDSEG